MSERVATLQLTAKEINLLYYMVGLSVNRRKAEIVALIMRKPRRWSELKKITGWSSSTLFRVLEGLEENNIVQREYIEKKIQWTITKKGKIRFLKKGKDRLPIHYQKEFESFMKKLEAATEEAGEEKP